jgi:hypothetical protein
LPAGIANNLLCVINQLDECCRQIGVDARRAIASDDSRAANALRDKLPEAVASRAGDRDRDRVQIEVLDQRPIRAQG